MLFRLRHAQRALVATGLLLAALGAVAEVRPFVAGSYQRMVAERSGRPFILAIWSVTCTHCPTELKALGELRKANPKLEVVLVAADAPEVADQSATLARRYGLGQAEQWIFADPMPERLRYVIDPTWHGELPRTQFHDGRGGVETAAGVVPRERLVRWVREQGR